VMRDGLRNLGKAALLKMKGSGEESFTHELRWRFYLGYALRRWKLQE